MTSVRPLTTAAAAMLVSLPLSAQAVEDRFFDSDGVKIRYVEKGKGDPLVLIHGFTGNVEMMWQMPGIIDELAKDYRVIALDCRGHGKSDKPHEADAYGPEMAADVVRLLDHLQIDKAHLFGYSMGGCIAFAVLAEHPGRVLSALPCGFGWEPPDADDDGLLPRVAASLEERGSLRPLMEFLSPDGRIDEQQLEQIDLMVRLMNDTKALAAVARSLNDLRPDEEKLKNNEVPALAIVGSADPLGLAAQSMIGRMNKLEIKQIEGGDHMSTLGDPAFLNAVKAFLAKHAAADRR